MLVSDGWRNLLCRNGRPAKIIIRRNVRLNNVFMKILEDHMKKPSIINSLDNLNNKRKFWKNWLDGYIETRINYKYIRITFTLEFIYTCL